MADRDGGIVAPNEQSFTAAAAHANWDSASGFAPSLLDQPGAGAWPISGATFILVYKHPPIPAPPAKCLSSSTGPTPTATAWRRSWPMSPCRAR